MTHVISNLENLGSKHTIELIKTSCWNPYSIVVNNKAYSLGDIRFFDETGIQISCGRGWFGNNNELERVTFNLSSPVVRKTKESFIKKVPFILKKQDYNDEYALYIPVEELPKFEVSYKKECNMIMKYVDIGLPNPSINYIKQCVKYLSKSLDSKEKLRETIKALDVYNIEQKTEEDFESDIKNIVHLYKEMKAAYSFVKSYSVEDYLKEINIK